MDAPTQDVRREFGLRWLIREIALRQIKRDLPFYLPVKGKKRERALGFGNDRDRIGSVRRGIGDGWMRDGLVPRLDGEFKAPPYALSVCQ
jgi:hypothetical protein